MISASESFSNLYCAAILPLSFGSIITTLLSLPDIYLIERNGYLVKIIVTEFPTKFLIAFEFQMV